MDVYLFGHLFVAGHYQQPLSPVNNNQCYFFLRFAGEKNKQCAKLIENFGYFYSHKIHTNTRTHVIKKLVK